MNITIHVSIIFYEKRARKHRKLVIFQPDFLFRIVNENQAIKVYRPTATDVEGISAKFVLGS